MKKGLSREAKIGLITIIGLFLLYFGMNFLKGVDIFTPTNYYFVKFKNVSELQKSAPVYVDGFKVGLVNDILYDYENNEDFLVQISLDKSMKIETGTYVQISTGFTTGASLNIYLNKHVETYHSPGDTLEGRNVSGLMDIVSSEIVPQVTDLLPKIDSILTGLQLLITHPALASSFDHIERTTANLEKSTAQLNAMMSRDLPQIISNFNTISADFTEVSAELKKIEFEGTMRSVDSAIKNLDRMTQQMNSKDNSLGLLLNDRQLYDNLNETAFNASNLMFDLKENPKRYVHFSLFGRKSSPQENTQEQPSH